MVSYEDNSVKVAARVRPLLAKEQLDSCRRCVSVSEKNLFMGRRQFIFDYAFDGETSQNFVYNSCVEQLLNNVIEGYNATIFAYGQTGSGKTYTMGNTGLDNNDSSNSGVIPRVLSSLFNSLKSRNNNNWNVSLSYVELHNEVLHDLLEPSTSSKSIMIRESGSGGIVLSGVKEEEVFSEQEAMRYYKSGNLARTTASTLMNSSSSRSHSIFTILLHQSVIGDTGQNEIIISKFHLVDLAGSERAKKTGAQGERFKESISINSGLLALGNVISALSDDNKRSGHIPYRQSKLTRMLQDSLGGNSKTLMIACVSPTEHNYEETLNTLRYATRARNIKNKAVINKDPKYAKLAELEQQMRTLKQQINGNTEESQSEEDNKISILVQRNRNLNQQNNHLEQELMEKNQEIQEMEDRFASLANEYQQLAKRNNSSELSSCEDENTPVKETDQYLSPTISTRKNLKQMIGDFCKSNQQNQEILEGDKEQIMKLKERLQQKVHSTPPSEDQEKNTELKRKIEKQEEKINQLEKEKEKWKNKAISFEKELEGANEDLLKDEEIFADKLRYIRKLKEKIKTFEQDLRSFGSTFTNENSRPSSGKETNKVDSMSISVLDEDENVSQNPASQTSDSDPFDSNSDFQAEQYNLEKELAESDEKFNHEQNSMKSKIEQLQEEIQSKSNTIAELKSAQDEYLELSQKYKDKIDSLENEMSQTKIDLEMLLKHLEEADMEQNKKENEKSELRKQYEGKIRSIQEELKEAKRKQLNASQLVRLKDKTERKVSRLQKEVSEMRTTKSALEKKIKEDATKHHAEIQEYRSKINNIRRKLEKRGKTMKRLKTENNNQKDALKAKTQQLMQIRKQMNSQQQQKQSVNGHNISEDQVRKMKSKLNKEIDRYLKKQEFMENLGTELKRRESIVKQREEAIARKNQLQLRKLRRSHDVKSSVQNLQSNVDSLAHQMQDLESELNNRSNTDEKQLSLLKAKMNKLQNEKEEKLKEKQRIAEQSSMNDKKEPVENKSDHNKEEISDGQSDTSENRIEEEEEIKHLEELEDILDAELEAEDERIAAAKSEVGELNQKRLDEIVENMERGELETTFKTFMDRFHENKKHEKEVTEESKRMKVEINEKNQEIQKLEAAMHDQEKKHDKEVQELIQQVRDIGMQNLKSSPETQRVSELERLVKDQHEQLNLMREEFIKLKNERNRLIQTLEQEQTTKDQNDPKKSKQQTPTQTEKINQDTVRRKSPVSNYNSRLPSENLQPSNRNHFVRSEFRNNTRSRSPSISSAKSSQSTDTAKEIQLSQYSRSTDGTEKSGLRGEVEKYKASRSAQQRLLGLSRSKLNRRSIKDIASAPNTPKNRPTFHKRSQSWSSPPSSETQPMTVADITQAVQKM